MGEPNGCVCIVGVLLMLTATIYVIYTIEQDHKSQDQLREERDQEIVDEGICTNKRIEPIENTIRVHYIVEIDTEPYKVDEDQYNKCHINDTIRLYASGRIEIESNSGEDNNG
jgi:Ca2+/Na+ antiporter